MKTLRDVSDIYALVELIAAELFKGVPASVCARKYRVPYEFALLVRDMVLDRNDFRKIVEQVLAELRLGVPAKICYRRYGLSYQYVLMLKDHFAERPRAGSQEASAEAQAWLKEVEKAMRH